MPLALLATMPPIVATSALPPGEGGKKRPWGLTTASGRAAGSEEASRAAEARSAGRVEQRSARISESARSTVGSSPAAMPVARSSAPEQPPELADLLLELAAPTLEPEQIEE